MKVVYFSKDKAVKKAIPKLKHVDVLFTHNSKKVHKFVADEKAIVFIDLDADEEESLALNEALIASKLVFRVIISENLDEEAIEGHKASAHGAGNYLMKPIDGDIIAGVMKEFSETYQVESKGAEQFQEMQVDPGVRDVLNQHYTNSSPQLDSAANNNIQDKFDGVFGEDTATHDVSEMQGEEEDDTPSAPEISVDLGGDSDGGGFDISVDDISLDGNSDRGEVTQATMVIDAEALKDQLTSETEIEEPEAVAAPEIVEEPVVEPEAEVEEISFDSPDEEESDFDEHTQTSPSIEDLEYPDVEAITGKINAPSLEVLEGGSDEPVEEPVEAAVEMQQAVGDGLDLSMDDDEDIAEDLDFGVEDNVEVETPAMEETDIELGGIEEVDSLVDISLGDDSSDIEEVAEEVSEDSGDFLFEDSGEIELGGLEAAGDEEEIGADLSFDDTSGGLDSIDLTDDEIEVDSLLGGDDAVAEAELDSDDELSFDDDEEDDDATVVFDDAEELTGEAVAAAASVDDEDDDDDDDDDDPTQIFRPGAEGNSADDEMVIQSGGGAFGQEFKPNLAKSPFADEDDDDEATVVFGGDDTDQSLSDLVVSQPTEEDIVAPQVAAQTSTGVSEVHQVFEPSAEQMGLSEDELIRRQGTIRQMRLERDHLLEDLESIRKEKQLLEHDNLGLRAELDEVKIEVSLAKKRNITDLEDSRYQLKMLEDKNALLEEKNHQYKTEFERLNQKVRIDLNQIRRREKELEGQLEMIKMDSENQLKSRENKILELKRKIDTLEFNIENVSIQEGKSKQDKQKLEESLHKVMQTLRNSMKALETDIDIEGELPKRFKKAN